MSKNYDILERYNKPNKFQIGDVLTVMGKERLMVYRNDSSVFKYALFNLKTRQVIFEPKGHVDQYYIKIGAVDVEVIKLLFL